MSLMASIGLHDFHDNHDIHDTHGNAIFDILESHAFKTYGTCLVF